MSSINLLIIFLFLSSLLHLGILSTSHWIIYLHISLISHFTTPQSPCLTHSLDHWEFQILFNSTWHMGFVVQLTTSLLLSHLTIGYKENYFAFDSLPPSLTEWKPSIFLFPSFLSLSLKSNLANFIHVQSLNSLLKLLTFLLERDLMNRFQLQTFPLLSFPSLLATNLINHSIFFHTLSNILRSQGISTNHWITFLLFSTLSK
jgi:hypothetical protein